MRDQTRRANPGRCRTKRLLRGFDRAVARTDDILTARYGRTLARTLIAEAREEYARLIPELPDLGGKQPFTLFVVATGWFLAFHRALARHGRPPREAGEFAYALTARYVDSLPRIAARFFTRVWFSALLRKRMRRRAAESQARRYPCDFVYEYVEGDGTQFDFGVDYTECAVWQFLQAQHAPELAPYVCALDQLYSDAFGWGLVRTTTLAEGGNRCDFRFTKHGPTRITSTVLPLRDR